MLLITPRKKVFSVIFAALTHSNGKYIKTKTFISFFSHLSFTRDLSFFWPFYFTKKVSICIPLELQYTVINEKNYFLSMHLHPWLRAGSIDWNQRIKQIRTIWLSNTIVPNNKFPYYLLLFTNPIKTNALITQFVWYFL